MRVVRCDKYGPAAEALKVAEMEKPQPKAGEVLVKLKATSATSGDCRIRGLNVPSGFGMMMRLMLGFRGPRQPILGLNFSGVVEALGQGARAFEVGDEVFGSTEMRMGCYAEYVSVPVEMAVAKKPKSVSFEEAAVFPFGAMTALSFLRDKAKLQPSQSILIYGASGAVGAASVQLAKQMGARVTGVCSSANQGLVASLGADAVLDYRVQDMSQLEREFDVVFDTVGMLGLANGIRLTRRGGVCLFAVAGVPDLFRILWKTMTSGRKVSGGVATEKKDDLEYLLGFLSRGLLLPVIDRSYRLEEMVEAHEYVERGRKKGNVAILVD
ncbi:NAD(P)-dependent alcohol dehydrogenase [Pelagicoccus sp. SDUM812003]|uniref:NAD(P)-dependent alcohol dehydrogenase n=1 Tax=Pelagicoccus sp. SDUM812003 TaxID=3041267 RepID=UPI002810481B|nr:NAD(P)-dependent alcohol dehydrogenase [Pelagicoccus sp. SDUM812003]MDQ8201780.1 NAD(P)-dependent alcohol dehydrogenase [Pelagicoccus sp. SDUM812003]